MCGRGWEGAPGTKRPEHSYEAGELWSHVQKHLRVNLAGAFSKQEGCDGAQLSKWVWAWQPHLGPCSQGSSRGPATDLLSHRCLGVGGASCVFLSPWEEGGPECWANSVGSETPVAGQEADFRKTHPTAHAMENRNFAFHLYTERNLI